MESKSVLFICTGNYYRSRFADILLNHLNNGHNGLNASSKGLAVSPRNVGPLSKHAYAYLVDLKIDPSPYLRSPEAINEKDFLDFQYVIAMDETEHRPMMATMFPQFENKIIYWNFEDDYIESPDIILPNLEKKVNSFFKEVITQ